MIEATIALTVPDPAVVPRAGTRGLPLDLNTLAILAMAIGAFTGRRRTIAQIDDEGVWTSSNPKVAAVLNQFFGAGYETMAYYSPLGRHIEVARDVAHALGGEVVGEAVDEADTEEGVVF